MKLRFNLNESNKTKQYFTKKILQIYNLHKNKGQLFIRFGNNQNLNEINPNYKWLDTPQGIYCFILNPLFLKTMLKYLRTNDYLEFDEKIQWAYDHQYMALFSLKDHNTKLFHFSKENPNITHAEGEIYKTEYMNIIKKLIQIKPPQNYKDKNEIEYILNKRFSYKNEATFSEILKVIKHTFGNKSASIKEAFLSIGYSGIITDDTYNQYGGFTNEAVFFNPSILNIEYQGINLFRQTYQLLKNTRI